MKIITLSDFYTEKILNFRSDFYDDLSFKLIFVSGPDCAYGHGDADLFFYDFEGFNEFYNRTSFRSLKVFKYSILNIRGLLNTHVCLYVEDKHDEIFDELGKMGVHIALNTGIYS